MVSVIANSVETLKALDERKLNQKHIAQDAVVRRPISA